MNTDFFEKNATDVLLEAEVNPSGAAKFEADYEAATGIRPSLGEGYQHQPNKWGVEVRVYFNSDEDLSDEFAALDVYIEVSARPYRNSREYRTNDREFFWALVNNGYRLGAN